MPSHGNRRHRHILAGTHLGRSAMALWGLAVVLGVGGALGALVLRILIALVHNAAFLGRLSIDYDANVHTAAAPWGGAIVLVPVVGAVLVVFLVRTFAPEAKGHGVPEVMDAIYYGKSLIRPVVAAIKALASAVSIGTGGSVGREGPIIQIGAALGSTTGQLARVSRWQRATLVAAGGAAGIAATFNTPIGGLLFAVEILLHEVSARTLVPVALATTTATYVGRWLFGDSPAFPVPSFEVPDGLALLPAYVVLGVVTAGAAILFIRTLYGSEDLFDRMLPDRPYLRHAIGMLAVGTMFTLLFSHAGAYHIEGVGYATILDILRSPLSIEFLIALFALKLLATSFTLGSGASGGIFAPSMFMGATLGAAVGVIAASLLPAHEIPLPVFALAGMAGMLAGSTGAVLTAVVMPFEMTLDYGIVLPMALAASVSYGVRRLWLKDSIYTMKLSRRGHVMPEAMVSNAHLIHHLSDLTVGRATIVAAGDSPEQLDLAEQHDDSTYVVVAEGGTIVGVFSREWARAHRDELARARRLDEVTYQDHIVIDDEATLFELLEQLQKAKASVAVVVRTKGEESGIDTLDVGIITKAQLAGALAEGMELFED